MIDYYEQLTQEEKEDIQKQETGEKKKKRSQRSSRHCTVRHFSWKENLINVREGCSIQKNTVPVRSIWNFLKHILRWRGSHCGKMYIWV